jgi:hypothetical protein
MSPSFSIYPHDHAGRPTHPEELDAASDEAALSDAANKYGHSGAQVWEGSRFVGVVPTLGDV